MNKNYLLILLLIIGASISSCTKSDIEYDNEFENSYDAWISFKNSTGNNYQYEVTSGSWTGSGSKTRIFVRGGKVVGRSFELWQIRNDGTGNSDLVEQWMESESEINTHEGGAAAITLDEVYSQARSEWLIKRKNTQTYFEAKNDGMISTCGYTDKNCADDCFNGITISAITSVRNDL